MPTIEDLNGGFNLGDWVVLPLKGVLRRGDEEVRPMPKVFAVLLALAKRDGNLVTKDELIDEVWEGRAFNDEPIQQAIALLRRHFEDKRPYEYVETLQRRGYRLLKRVELHQQLDTLDAEPGTDDGRSLRLWKTVAAFVAIGFVAIVIYAIVFPPHSEPPVRSLAILPIENLSGDAEIQYIVEGIQTVLAHRLSEIPGFAIKNVRKPNDEEIVTVAKQLKVGHVLTGIMQLQSGTLKVTYEITRGGDGVIIGSGEVSGNLDGQYALQESLAVAVRDKLAGKETPELITRQEPDSAAYKSYMRGIYLLEHRGEQDNLELAIELFNESISLDQAFGPAYLALATAYALLPDYWQADLDKSQDLAISTIEKGIAADASIRDSAGAIYGYYYHKRKNWMESEAAHQRAINATVVDSNSFNWYSRMLASVGRLDDALEVALRAEKIDPDSTIAASRIAIAYTWVGQDEMAGEYFVRADDLDNTGSTYRSAYALMLIRGQHWEMATNLVTRGMQEDERPTEWVAPYFAGLADPAKRQEAILALDIAAADGRILPKAEFSARALIGDTDGAMRLAMGLDQPGEIFEMDLLFIPETRELRQHEEFMPLLQRLGVVDYWKAEGCQWTGDSVRCAGN